MENANRTVYDRSNRHSQHFTSFHNNNTNVRSFNIPQSNSQTKIDNNSIMNYQNQPYTKIGVPRDSFVVNNNNAQYLEVNKGSQIYRDD